MAPTDSTTVAAPQPGLTIGHFALLLLVCLCLFLPGFADLPLTDRDEARFAQASRQMMDSGDYVNITFQEQARHKKPVGIYWLQSASAYLFGTDGEAAAWPYRLPSLIGAIIAVFGTAYVGTLFFGQLVGMSAAILLAGTLLLGVEARLAKTDAVLLATIVVAQAALAKMYVMKSQAQPGTWAAVFAFWLAVGASILIKGPIIFMICGLTILYLVVAEREVRWLGMLRPLVGVLIAAVVILPWFVAITVETDGAFFRTSLGGDFLAKIGKGQESHGAPPGFYFIAFWPTFWPFSVVAALAVPWIWARRQEPQVRFCLAWLLPSWIVLELVATKLPHYILPVYPALAILTAAAWRDAFAGGGLRLRKASAFVALVGFAICGVILAGLFAVGTAFLQSAVNIAGLILAAVTLGLLTYMVLWWRGKADHAFTPMVALFAGALIFNGILFHFFLPSLDTIWLSKRSAAAYAASRICPTTRLALAGFTEPSLVFLTGTNTRLGNAEMVAKHLLADPACAMGLVDQKAEKRLLAALKKVGKTPEAVRKLSGVNYAKGKRLTLTLYRLPKDG